MRGIPEARWGEEPGVEEPGRAGDDRSGWGEVTTTTALDTSPTTTSIVTASTWRGGSTDLSPLGSRSISASLSSSRRPQHSRSFTVPRSGAVDHRHRAPRPDGCNGDLRIKRSGTTLFETQLANYRDLDFHFVSPYQREGGATVDRGGHLHRARTWDRECGASASFAGSKSRGNIVVP